MDKPHEEGGGRSLRRRITVNASRKMLGMVARNYSDDDLEKVLVSLYGIAEASFETYLDQDVIRYPDHPNSDPETD